MTTAEIERLRGFLVAKYPEVDRDVVEMIVGTTIVDVLAVFEGKVSVDAYAPNA